MRFEWDENKNEANQRKHGISFEIAAEAFDDRYLLIRTDCIDETGEQRYSATGAVWHPLLSAVLLVIHVYREYNNGEESIRIISARKADRENVRRYQEQAMD
jgi:uncharacterized protein